MQLGSSEGPAPKYTPKDADIDTVIETITVLQTPHRDVQLESVKWPSILVPEHKPYGVKTVDTLYSDEESWHDGHGHAYEGYGIDPSVGAVVIVRPDQYVSAVYGVQDFQSIGMSFRRELGRGVCANGLISLAAFFDKFMLRP